MGEGCANEEKNSRTKLMEERKQGKPSKKKWLLAKRMGYYWCKWTQMILKVDICALLIRLQAIPQRPTQRLSLWAVSLTAFICLDSSAQTNSIKLSWLNQKIMYHYDIEYCQSLPRKFHEGPLPGNHKLAKQFCRHSLIRPENMDPWDRRPLYVRVCRGHTLRHLFCLSCLKNWR